jgi:hypothetical protein
MIGDRAWIEGALARLISTSSPSGQEAAAQQFVEQMMREVGADTVRRVFVDAAALRDAYGFETPTPTEGMFAVVGEWGRRAASPFVLLNGHIDTVPATHGWAIDPLEPRITEGWMNGLGSADMKSGLVGDGRRNRNARVCPRIADRRKDPWFRDRLRADERGNRDEPNRQPGYVLLGPWRPGARQHETPGGKRRRGSYRWLATWRVGRTCPTAKCILCWARLRST